MMKLLINRLVLFLTLLPTTLWGAFEIDQVNCGAQVIQKQPRLRSDLRQVLEQRLIQRHHKTAAEAMTLVNRLERRLVFFEAWQAEELDRFESILGLVGIDDTERDQQLFVADLLESMPASLNPIRPWGNRVLPHLENHAGLPYLLDVLTLPVEAAEDWLEDHEFSAPKPEFLSPVRMRPLESAARTRARSQAIALAKRSGCKYVMENQNGTFTPLMKRPEVGRHFCVDLKECESVKPLAHTVPPEYKYAVINDVSGELVFLNKRPITLATEFFIFGPDGVNGPVMGHGATGPIEIKRIQRDFANPLADEWEIRNELHNEVTLVHRIAFYTIMERLAVDLSGATSPERMPEARNDVRAQLQAFLVQHRGRTFLEALQSYLQDHEPYNHIYSLEHLDTMED